ncbi:hypothetical protein AS156_04150 [Bradyrhizobium macuxiense]|uniref:Uncharacterized protein n=1 Tax=Bradyrhizobium macuxiense TaxID=1755647 RepID=A0A109JX12_9BRAD|nr:hypothetical protein AS156_04150 [Bradyrhizobium macuxiense]
MRCPGVGTVSVSVAQSGLLGWRQAHDRVRDRLRPGPVHQRADQQIPLDPPAPMWPKNGGIEREPTPAPGTH